jgi:hypothetical protein
MFYTVPINVGGKPVTHAARCVASSTASYAAEAAAKEINPTKLGEWPQIMVIGSVLGEDGGSDTYCRIFDLKIEQHLTVGRR